MEVKKAFEKLKSAMITTPLLALPDFSKVFVVGCDASTSALMQEG